MKAIALLLCLLTATAFAQPVDAPVASTDVVLTEAQAIKAAQRIASCEAERAVFRASPPPPPWWVVVLVSVAVGAAGVGAGYGLAKAAK